MSFFQKLFGQGDPLASARKAFAQKNWHDVLIFGERASRRPLDEPSRSELDRLLAEAGDRLAELNLGEGEACLRAGDVQRAGEHFHLAAGQARDAALREKIALRQGGVGLAEALSPLPAAAAAGCGSSCGAGHGCAEEVSAGGMEVEGLDEDMHLELLTAGYPVGWQQQVEASGGEFRRALLLAHGGDGKTALAQFAEVPEQDRGSLFFFERGALKVRLGDAASGVKDLTAGLTRDPENLLVFEHLVAAELAAGKLAAAETRLRAHLEAGKFSGFCHGRLAFIHFRRGEAETALAHGLKALEGNGADSDTIILTGHLLERGGRLEEAEGVLGRLKGGGCSGGANLHLAEFWLRHGKRLSKALESFKAAAREESGNPRWNLRIAQTYLALGWKKEGASLLENVLRDSRLEGELRQEGEALAQSLRSPGNAGSI